MLFQTEPNIYPAGIPRELQFLTSI